MGMGSTAERDGEVFTHNATCSVHLPKGKDPTNSPRCTTRPFSGCCYPHETFTPPNHIFHPTDSTSLGTRAACEGGWSEGASQNDAH